MITAPLWNSDLESQACLWPKWSRLVCNAILYCKYIRKKYDTRHWYYLHQYSRRVSEQWCSEIRMSILLRKHSAAARSVPNSEQCIKDMDQSHNKSCAHITLCEMSDSILLDFLFFIWNFSFLYSGNPRGCSGIQVHNIPLKHGVWNVRL